MMTNSQQTSASSKHKADDDSYTITFTITILFIIGNAVASAYRARGDPWTFGFAVFAYGTLLALLTCVRLLEKREDAGGKTGGLKAAVWVLATVLTVSFVWRVVQILLL
ncbi:hypothetical protein IEQ34_010615 [Dendrobium chrysotoxum]|uniref:Transmembrane protein n=1 Tax=Dendrobium chrysotoxum TaxID=161865 RepID=A0AAV7GV97_DENCH|nr:hypothetical protein IEQ34_010615 [Dendrobium chrysotoxum]